MLERIAHGNVLEIRLARPPVNALNPELLAALATAFAPAQLHGVEGVVLSGGPKVFSGGLDVPHLLGLDRAGLTAAWSASVRGAGRPVRPASAGRAWRRGRRR